jgi:hypothetical protein
MNGRTRLAPMSRQHLLRWALPAIVACLALVGCGGGGTASSSSSASSNVGASSSSSASSNAGASSSAGATQSAGLSAFQTCLKAHGVKIRPRASFSPGASFSPRAFPSGSGFPTAFPSGGFVGGFGGQGTGANSAAFKACQKYAPTGFRFGGGGTINASAIAAFKSCMSQNGVTVTTTNFASLAKLARSSKKAAAALNTCRVLLLQGFSRPTPSPTAT